MVAKIYENKQERRRAHYLRHRERLLEKSRVWRENNRGRMQEYNRRVQLRRFYGMTVEEFNEMLVAQDGACGICVRPLERGLKTHVDHSHKTGLVRGLLCDACNVGLGRFKDDPEVLRRAIDYLLRVQDRVIVS